MPEDKERIKAALKKTFSASPGHFSSVILKYQGDEVAKVDSKAKPEQQGGS